MRASANASSPGRGPTQALPSGSRSRVPTSPHRSGTCRSPSCAARTACSAASSTSAGTAARGRDPLPLAPRVADRGQLEGRDGELPRVLPLPDGTSGIQQGHRREPRRLRPAGVPHFLEPDRLGLSRGRRRHLRVSLRPAGFAGNGGAGLLPQGDVAQSPVPHFPRPRSTSHRASQISRSSDTTLTASVARQR
jgi:hypothetical protein